MNDRWSFLRQAQPGVTRTEVTSAMAAYSSASEALLEPPRSLSGEPTITNLRQWGFRAAGQALGSPEVLKTIIGWLYYDKIRVDDGATSEDRARIAALAQKVEQKRTELHQLASSEQRLEQEIASLDAQEMERREELARLRAGDPTLGGGHGLADRVSLLLAVGILVLLSVYLFLFYISAIYNAFLFDPVGAQREAITTGRDLVATIFNGAALTEARRQGWVTFVFLAAAPATVLALGFLIHQFTVSGRKIQSYLLYAITFGLDALLAYAIVAEMYEVRFLTGLEQTPWQMKLALQRPAFYIILFGGFVAYIIWGLILSYVLETLESWRPGQVARSRIEHALSALKAERERKQQVRHDLAQRRLEAEGAIRRLESQQAPGALSESFRRHVDELMHGWLMYISQASGDDRAEREREAQAVRDQIVQRLSQDAA
jgi:cell division protein FtsB